MRSWTKELLVKTGAIARHPLFRLTLIGLGIRLVLAPITQFTYDPVVWYSTGNDMLAGLGAYQTKTYSYPPLWAYSYFPFLLIASSLVDPRSFGTHVSQMNWISLAVGYSPTILSPVFLLATRAPLIIGDLATGFLLFKLVKGYSGFSLARKAYVFWLFNPIVIWTSSVEGQFDILPAMFTLLSLVLLVRSRYLQSGISISIAVLYKLYPLYLLPLYLILTWTDMGRERHFIGRFHSSLRRVCLFCGGGFLPLLGLLPFLSISDMLHAVFARQAYLSSVGGLSPWMLNYAPGFGWIWDFASNNLLAIGLATSIIAIAVSSLCGWALIRSGPTDTLRVIRTHILAISAIYTTLFTVNPQYVLWILPFLTVIMFTNKVYRKRGMLLVGLATAWQVTISGPLVFLPMIYFGLPTQLLTAPVESILIALQPPFNPVLLVSGFVGGVVVVSFLVEKPSWLLTRHFPLSLGNSQPQITLRELGKSVRAASTYLLIMFMIALSLSAVLAQTPSGGRFVPTSIDSTLNGNLLTTQGSFVVANGNLPLELNLVAAPIASLGKDRPVYVYYDPIFPALGNNARGWNGILDHLPAELRLRGYSASIQIVNAKGLRQVMSLNSTSVIVIPSGVFPSTVQNATEGLVGNWLRSGGVLVWMGGPFGFHSTPVAKQDLDPFTTNMSIAIASQNNILGYRLTEIPLNGTSRMATLTTSFSSALGLTYSDVWVAPTLELLRSVGGLAIGHLQSSSDTSRSSLSIVPVGLGKIILFGGPVSNLLTADGEDVIAHDAAQILSLGDFLMDGEIKSSTFAIPPAESISLSFSASFNTTSAAGVVLMGFSDYNFSRLFWKTEVPVRTGS